jgi:molecular chaperone DnaK (HSP70)
MPASPVPYIGIDFGTCKSVMTWYNARTGQAEPIRNEEGEEETPSILYLGSNEAESLVGKMAQRKLNEDEHPEYNRFVLSVKRNLVNAPARVLDNKVYRPVDLAARILAKLKKDAEVAHFHRSVQHVVVTYPASFDTLQQDKIKQAALQAGFTDVILLAEPVAAAIAYERAGLEVGRSVLVYDFGAGTFDVAVLTRLSDGMYTQILPPRGLLDCGGDDLDRELYNYCQEIALQTLRRPISSSPGLLDLQFLLQCRERKENLSFSFSCSFNSYLDRDTSPVLFKHTLQRGQFEARIRPYIERTVHLTKLMCGEASAKGSPIDTVVLIGGSSRIPLVSTLLLQSLPVAPRPWAQRDFAVALGASYYAHDVWDPKPAVKPEPHPEGSKPKPDRVDSILGPSGPVAVGVARPEEQYRAEVKKAWAEKTSPQYLSKAQVSTLDALVSKYSLAPATAASIELEVLGRPRENMLEPQYRQARDLYRGRITTAIADRHLTTGKVDELTRFASQLSLDGSETAAIEVEVMGNTKEVLLARGGMVPLQNIPDTIRMKKRWRMSAGKVVALILFLTAGIVSSAAVSSAPGVLVVCLPLLAVSIWWFFRKTPMK